MLRFTIERSFRYLREQMSVEHLINDGVISTTNEHFIHAGPFLSIYHLIGVRRARKKEKKRRKESSLSRAINQGSRNDEHNCTSSKRPCEAHQLIYRHICTLHPVHTLVKKPIVIPCNIIISNNHQNILET